MARKALEFCLQSFCKQFCKQIQNRVFWRFVCQTFGAGHKQLSYCYIYIIIYMFVCLNNIKKEENFHRSRPLLRKLQIFKQIPRAAARGRL